MRFRVCSYDFVKRFIDILVSAVALIVTLPIQLAVSILVRIALGRPILFRQDRPGRNGVVFSLVKFRTMLEVSPNHMTDEERLTKVGRFLRSSSFDELPTLWNVLKGDMSLVGPRPLLVSYLTQYSEEQARRHQVRPGVTGLAQINGRNLISWDERLQLDVEYVDNYSFILDLKILMRTISVVIRKEGISQKGHATMPIFQKTIMKESEN